MAGCTEMTTPVRGARTAWDDVWIVIPAFNESRTIRPLVKAVLAICPRVIVVDDGSDDGTSSLVADLPATLLRNDINQGKAASLRTAFAYARGQSAQCAITMDGDGQHDPADAEFLLEAWRRHPQRIVIGSRLHDRARFPPARYYANRFACFWISWAAGHPIADSQCGYRVYPRTAMDLALGSEVRGDRFTFESEILIEAADNGITTLAVSIPGHYPANARRSHFRPVIDIAKIVAMVAWRLIRQRMAVGGLWNSLGRVTVLPGRPTTAIPMEATEIAGGAQSAPTR